MKTEPQTLRADQVYQCFEVIYSFWQKDGYFFHDKILTLANFWRNEVIYDEY